MKAVAARQTTNLKDLTIRMMLPLSCRTDPPVVQDR
jgi:hypothetical protein